MRSNGGGFTGYYAASLALVLLCCVLLCFLLLCGVLLHSRLLLLRGKCAAALCGVLFRSVLLCFDAAALCCHCWTVLLRFYCSAAVMLLRCCYAASPLCAVALSATVLRYATLCCAVLLLVAPALCCCSVPLLCAAALCCCPVLLS